jgi:membrane-associated phospholipid phosphatase
MEVAMTNSTQGLKRARIASAFCGAFIACVATPAPTRAGEVTDWNRELQTLILTAKQSPIVSTRTAAIVQAAVFDALNGIERRYTPVHATPDAPRGASRRAAVVQAAYGTLVALFPSEKGTLDALRTESLASIAADQAIANSDSITRGLEWGQRVADEILRWRSTDGFVPAPPPFLGGAAIGEWRPTPPTFAPGALPQFAYMTPWAMTSPSQFRPAGPPDLTSAQYANDVNEVKQLGVLSSSTRTPDQTEIAVFWTANTPVLWNRLAVTIADERHLTLSETARLLMSLNVAMADAVIACWDGKYHYVFWRPITAIRLADMDPNPLTDVDPAWTPLLPTPTHPEYPANHATVSGAASTMLAYWFGDATAFVLESEVLPDVTRSYSSFSAAAAEANDARVYGGMHFRTSVRDGRTLGGEVAGFVIANVAQPLRLSGAASNSGGERSLSRRQ